MNGTRYDPIADWYGDWAESSPWVHRVVMQHLPALTAGLHVGSSVLDLGCGEGTFARILEADGYRVVGIDCSERLIMLARTRSPAAIAFVIDDAQTLDSQPSGTFDGVICVLALMDIPDLDAVFRAVRRVVHSGGVLSCVVMHPAFDAPGASWLDGDIMAARVVPRYLTEGEWWSGHSAGVRGQVGAWHRSFATYLTTAIGTGWNLQTIAEWPGLPGEAPNDEIPRLLFMRFVRMNPAPGFE
ncbi:MAG: methyltransferase domain-containing protein [Thermomicrobiales bacterium]